MAKKKMGGLGKGLDLLFADLRIDEEGFSKLNRKDLQFLCPKYHKATLTQLSLFLNREGQ